MNNSTLNDISKSILNQQQQQAFSAGTDNTNQLLTNNSGQNSPLATLPTDIAPSPDQSTPQPAAPTDHGNWLTHLLPTIGSIAAPVVGGLLAPETGGLSLLAGLALASGGSAAGKAVENTAEGQNVTKDLGTSALEGGVGQLTGGVLGKVVGAGTKIAGNAAEKASANVVQKQFGDQIDKATAQHLIDHGITDRAQAVAIANRVTGSEGALPKTINDVFKNSDRVADVSDLDPTLIKTSDNSNVFNMDRAGLNPQSQKTALANAETILNSHVGPGDLTKVPQVKGAATTPLYANGSLQNALPEDVFSMAKKFEGLARKAADTAYDRAGTTVNAQQANLSKYYKSVADELNQRAFGVGQDAIPLTDEAKQALLNNFDDLKTSSPQAYTSIAQQINGAKTLQDLRSVQAPWVRVAQGDRIAQAIQNGSGGVSAGEMLSNAAPIIGGASGGVKGLATGLAVKAMNSPAANKAGASVLGKISETLSNPNMQKIVSNAALVPTQTIAHAPTDFTQAAGTGQTLEVPQELNGQNVMQNPSAINAIMNNNSVLGQVAKMELSAMMNPFSGQHGLDQAGMDSLKSLQGPISIQAQLPELIREYNAAGGAQGAMGGLLQTIGGKLTGGPAAQYQQRADALRQEYKNATGQDLLLPTIGMNQNAAQSTLAQLAAALSVNR